MRARLEAVETVQQMLVARATGNFPPDGEYRDLRERLINDSVTGPRLPRFVRTCRDLGQSWAYISKESGTYQGRREHIWAGFRPLLEFLESTFAFPADAPVTDAIGTLDAESVAALWKRALERRASDPEGAITAARTSLESVCKHILDDLGITYSADVDLPGLYSLTAQSLKLAPSQHSEDIFQKNSWWMQDGGRRISGHSKPFGRRARVGAHGG